MTSSMLYTCIAGVAFLSWYVLKLCCHWVRSVIMCYSHVLLFNFRYSPYHYTNDFGFNTHESDSKEVFVFCHYIWLFSSSHALKEDIYLTSLFYCINSPLCFLLCLIWITLNVFSSFHVFILPTHLSNLSSWALIMHLELHIQ